MSNWKGIAGVMLVFILGVITGSIISPMIWRSQIERIMRAGPGPMGHMIVDRMSEDLKLDKGQREQLRSIIQEMHGEMEKVHRQSFPLIKDVFDKTDIKIIAILHPEQIGKFKELIAERKEHEKHGEHGGPAGHGEPWRPGPEDMPGR
ncbi:MAG: hypothetical protein HQK89_10145 [Nitrospirae bacterium]|nr:hypothetical protein [Nitrospirota bacterium]